MDITEIKTWEQELSEPYQLPDNAVNFFNEFGYVKLKDVLSDSLLSYYGDIITDWVFKLNKLTKPMEERTTYERAFLQVMNLWRESSEVREFVFPKDSRRLQLIC